MYTHSNLSKQDSTEIIFCDFSKAFDCMNYILIRKLQYNGLVHDLALTVDDLHGFVFSDVHPERF